MERIGLVGANSRTKSAELVANLTLPKSERVARLPSLAAEIGVTELIYIGTCNRVEIAFLGDGRTDVGEYRRRVFGALLNRAPEPGEAERSLSAWVGEGAVEHLFLVAAGLDSARLGEREIHHQVREALEMARQAGVSGSLLDHVLTKALTAAGQARRRSPDGDQPASLGDIAVEHLLDRLHETPGAAAIVGVSPMTRHCAARLAGSASRLLVVNRSAEAGEGLAREVGGEYRSLDAFREQPDEVEALLVSTGSPDILFGRPELERLAARTPSCEPPLVVDMSVPPNTDRAAAEAVGVDLVDMDAILGEASADREARLCELAPARQRIDESVARLRKSMAERAISPVIARLHQRY
ncbi:MAG: hypothetical protein R3244_03370, partial [Thermoanaerobaculia bacterium]|nr:hypothetical protein [Thermoanaerobaculia bacterium]